MSKPCKMFQAPCQNQGQTKTYGLPQDYPGVCWANLVVATASGGLQQQVTKSSRVSQGEFRYLILLPCVEPKFNKKVATFAEQIERSSMIQQEGTWK